MSMRVDQRSPTLVELEVYNKCLKLTDHTLSVCKVKENKTNNKHIVKRQLRMGQMLVELVVQIGADIIEANNKYVGGNLNNEDRQRHYKERLLLQEHAKSLTYRMEHIIRVLHFNRPFADSTITYWITLLVDTRNLLIKWKEKDYNLLKGIKKEKEQEQK